MAEIIMVCKQCNEEMPVNKEESNENWKVYKNECECGGKGKPIFKPH